MTYPDPQVQRTIADRFVPLRLHLFTDRAVVRPFQVFWTPTILIGDRSGKIRYRSINFLPPREYLGILDIGEALVRMRWKEYDLCLSRLDDAVARDPDGPLAAEALYWKGIGVYFQGNHDVAGQRQVWAEIQERFPDSIWAKRQP